MTDQVKGIHYLRGVAALLVVFHHSILQIPTFRQSYEWIEFGQGGVDIFFVISGFVIYLASIKEQIAPVEFIKRRIIRVVPLYWAATLALVLAVAVVPHVFATTILSPSSVLQSLFFVPAYSAAFPDQIWPVLVPGWSLNYEMFFYAVFALGLLVDRAHLLRFLVGTLGAFTLLGLLLEPHLAPLKTYTDMRLLEFLAGVVLARLYMSAGFDKRSWLAILLPVGVGLLLISPVVSLPRLERIEPWAGPAIMIVAGILALEARRPLSNSAWLVRLGDASYSLYLSHLFTLGVLRIIWSKAGIPVDGLAWAILWFATALCVCVGASIVVHQRLEKPLLAGARRIFAGRGKQRPSVGGQLRQGVQRMMRRAW